MDYFFIQVDLLLRCKLILSVAHIHLELHIVQLQCVDLFSGGHSVQQSHEGRNIDMGIVYDQRAHHSVTCYHLDFVSNTIVVYKFLVN